MKKQLINEAKRLQELAGINEVKIQNPVYMKNLSKEELEALAVDIYDNVFEMESGDDDLLDLHFEMCEKMFGHDDLFELSDEDTSKCSSAVNDLLERSIKKVYGEEMVIKMV
jgi:hypothetical protein